LIPKGGLI
jgi:hypothetical protein